MNPEIFAAIYAVGAVLTAGGLARSHTQRQSTEPDSGDFAMMGLFSLFWIVWVPLAALGWAAHTIYQDVSGSKDW